MNKKIYQRRFSSGSNLNPTFESSSVELIVKLSKKAFVNVRITSIVSYMIYLEDEMTFETIYSCS